MLPDPVTVAASSPTPELILGMIKQDGYGSERFDGTNGYTVIINHTRGKNGNRHYVQMTQAVDAPDPYSGAIKRQVASVSLTIQRPQFGFTDAATVALVKALTDFVYDGEVTPAKLIQFQS